MNTNSCPICDEKTVGKPVRRVHFCEKHRKIAIMIRDSEDLKKIEKKRKRYFWDLDFSNLILNYVNDGNSLLRYQVKYF